MGTYIVMVPPIMAAMLPWGVMGVELPVLPTFIVLGVFGIIGGIINLWGRGPIRRVQASAFASRWADTAPWCIGFMQDKRLQIRTCHRFCHRAISGHRVASLVAKDS